MKKVMLLLIVLLLFCFFVCVSCSKVGLASPTPTPTPVGSQASETDGSKDSPGVPVSGGKQVSQPNETAPQETQKRSTTYGPSIFVIEASGSWRHQVDTGIYVNYECELYLDKIEPYNMHDDNGAYTGVFWLKLTVDVSEQFSKIIKSVPMVNISLETEAEGIQDSVSFYLRDGYTRDPTANFDIPDGQGGYLKPDHGALADKGSFVVRSTYGNINYHFEDRQKDLLIDYQKSGGTDTEVSYIVHVAPDPTREATERAAKIHLILSDGSSTVLDGVWRRLPGYPDDLEKYYNSGKSREILEKHQ